MTEAEILSFARATVGSLWELQLLLALHKSAGRAWTPEQLNGEIHANTQIVNRCLHRLQARRIVARTEEGEYEYRPAHKSTEAAVDALASLFALKPFAVMNSVVAARSDGLQSFSDAFKLKDD